MKKRQNMIPFVLLKQMQAKMKKKETNEEEELNDFFGEKVKKEEDK